MILNCWTFISENQQKNLSYIQTYMFTYCLVHTCSCSFEQEERFIPCFLSRNYSNLYWWKVVDYELWIFLFLLKSLIFISDLNFQPVTVSNLKQTCLTGEEIQMLVLNFLIDLAQVQVSYFLFWLFSISQWRGTVPSETIGP